MSANDWQIEQLVGDSRSCVKGSSTIDYSKFNFGEAEYRKACGLIANLLETKQITTRKARKLLALAETRLRVHRPAISMEASLETQNLRKSMHKSKASPKARALAGNVQRNSCGGLDHRTTSNGRMKAKRGGRGLI